MRSPKHWLMRGCWVGFVAWSWLGTALGCPDVEESIRPVFSHPVAILASESFGTRQYLQSAAHAVQALEDRALLPDERPYLLFLRFLALDRAGQHRQAQEPLRLLFEEGIPADLAPHASYYLARTVMFRGALATEEEKRFGLSLIEKVEPTGRFGRVAHSVGLRWRLSLDELEEGGKRARELADRWRGYYAEAEALLLLAEGDERRASKQEEAGDAQEAARLRRQAASVYQELELWWPATAQGAQAKRALLTLKRRGVTTTTLDEPRILDRARVAVRYLRNKKTLRQLSRVRDQIPGCPARALCHELDLLVAQLASGVRELRVAERAYLRVAALSPDPELRARAEMGLAGLSARKSLIDGTEAYLEVERRWPSTQAAPSALFQAGELARRMGSFRVATEAYQRCVDRYPERRQTASCTWGLGWLAWRNGSLGDARLWFQDLLVSSATSAAQPAPTGLGISAQKAADKDEVGSAEWLQKVRYWHARIQEELGERDAASLAYRDLVLGRPYGYYALLSWERLGGLGRKLELPAALSSPAERLLQDAVYGVLRREGGTPRADEDTYESFFCDPRTPGEQPSGELRAVVAYLRMRLYDEARATLLSLRPAELSRVDRRLGALAYRVMGDALRSHRMAPISRDGGLPGFPEGDLRLEAELAFPRAFGEVVEGPARAAEVPSALMFALIRTESAFEPRAESPARALGLTQVIRPTAEETARTLGISRFRFQSLFEPQTSVQIGSAYLGQLLRQFDGNPALAAAAYNAGAASVNRWLTRQGDVPIDVFVEEIPYQETNLYVRTVLTAYAIYRALYDEPAGPPIGLAFRISRALWDRVAINAPGPAGARKPG